MNTVRKYYDEHAESEWKRLFRDAYHRLEFIVTRQFLEEYLPKTGLMLDDGGGPTNRLYRDTEKWTKWRGLILKTWADPVLLGTREHLLYIGQR